MSENNFLEIVFGVAALLAGTYFWFVFMRKRDRLEPEPVRALIHVLLLGGLLSALAALVGNETLDAVTNGGFEAITGEQANASALNVFSFFIFSALIEEICKYSTAYWLIRKHKEVNEPVDGVIYAVAVGLGFSLFENILYLVMHGGTVAFFRLFLAVPLHMATAAIWGIYFANTLAQKRPMVYLSALPQVLVAVALHAAWNSSASLLGGFFILLAPFVLRYCLKRVGLVMDQLHEQSPFHPNNGRGEIIALDAQNSSVSQPPDQINILADNSVSENIYEILPNGKKRYLKATWFDIVVSAVVPIWGLVVGVFALTKGEKRRGLTMIAACVAGGVLVALLRNL